MRLCFRVVTMATLLTAPAIAWAQVAPGTPAAKPAEAPPSAAAPQPATPAEQAHVDGFRSTKWGMTEAQVRGAIHADFNIPDDKIKHTENLAEKTQVVSAVVPDLLEGAGNAEVSYIFGYASKKLIQVNALWGTAVDSQATPVRWSPPPTSCACCSSNLRPINREPSPRTPRWRTASILVFQGQDADKHGTLLRLGGRGTASPSGRNGKPGKAGRGRRPFAVLHPRRHRAGYLSGKEGPVLSQTRHLCRAGVDAAAVCRCAATG